MTATCMSQCPVVAVADLSQYDFGPLDGLSVPDPPRYEPYLAKPCFFIIVSPPSLNFLVASRAHFSSLASSSLCFLTPSSSWTIHLTTTRPTPTSTPAQEIKASSHQPQTSRPKQRKSAPECHTVHPHHPMLLLLAMLVYQPSRTACHLSSAMLHLHVCRIR